MIGRNAWLRFLQESWVVFLIKGDSNDSSRSSVDTRPKQVSNSNQIRIESRCWTTNEILHSVDCHLTQSSVKLDTAWVKVWVTHFSEKNVKLLHISITLKGKTLQLPILSYTITSSYIRVHPPPPLGQQVFTTLSIQNNDLKGRIWHNSDSNEFGWNWMS